jgi:hypothetical protein
MPRGKRFHVGKNFPAELQVPPIVAGVVQRACALSRRRAARDTMN